MGNPYSNLKIFRHKEYLDAIENGEWMPPIYIRIKPTNHCNHHCAYCTYGSGDTDQKTENRDNVDHRSIIPWEDMQNILKDVCDMGVKAVTFSGGGEPLTYPKIKESARILQDSGIELSLISNGELLDEERATAFYKAKWVRISFDSPNKEEYCRLRNLKPERFDRVVNNIREFAGKKDGDCVLGVNYVVGKANAHRVYEAAELLKNLGVNNVKFAALIDNQPNYHRDIKDNVIKQIHNAINDFSDDHFQIFNNYENDWKDKNFAGVPYEQCYTCRLVTVIGADQKVYLCHTQAYDSNAVVGDIRDKGFKALWNSKETRDRLKSLCPRIDCKCSCVYEGRNQAILGYFDSNKHINFI
ncbi:MAG: radical SAM protein [Lachnospiraceae bacterium]|nr:radical SAM protein [Lachnospiraceae bacterium]